MTRFTGRTIIVTGAGSGIGAACVRRLAADGAAVVAADIRLEDVETVLAGLPDASRTQALRLDVTNEESVSAGMTEAVRLSGDLFGLVNSAGIRVVGGAFDLEAEAWRRVMAVNVDGTFNMCQAFARAVRRNPAGKAIVNLSSTAGVRGVAQRLGYTASKHAVTGLTRSLALELGPLGMRVNAVAPGTIRTPMTASLFEGPDGVNRIRSSIPVGREGLPEEVAGPVAFLLSDDATFINGAILSIDGGSTIGIGRTDVSRLMVDPQVGAKPGIAR